MKDVHDLEEKKKKKRGTMLECFVVFFTTVLIWAYLDLSLSYKDKKEKQTSQREDKSWHLKTTKQELEIEKLKKEIERLTNCGVEKG